MRKRKHVPQTATRSLDHDSLQRVVAGSTTAPTQTQTTTSSTARRAQVKEFYEELGTFTP